MKDIVVKIPEELKFIRQTSEIDWSVLVSKVIKSKLDKIVRLQRIVNKSELSEKDVGEFSDKINASLSQKYL